MLPENSRCVKSHTSCSWAHADLVRTYTEERQRLEMERDEHQENTRTPVPDSKRYEGLVTFKEWLIGSRR